MLGALPPAGAALVWSARLVTPAFGYALVERRGARRLLVRRAGRVRDVTPRGLRGWLEDAVFTDPARGFAVSDDCSALRGWLYRTADGGRSWRRLPGESALCHAGSGLSLDVLGPQRAWLVDLEPVAPFAALYRTRDGGRRWSVLPRLPLLAPVVFASAREGWQAGQAGGLGPGASRLLRSSDGGARWRPRPVRLPAGWRGARPRYGAPAFFAGGRGVLPVTLHGRQRAAVAFYVRAGTGRPWRLRSLLRVAAPPALTSWLDRPVPTAVASPTAWWVLSGRRRAVVQVTRDAGRRWTTVRPRGLPLTAFVAASAADARRAWLVAGPPGRGRLYATADGGRRFTRLRP